MSPGDWLDFASVFVFGLTGGLAASRAQLDVVGFVFLACLTGVGGGTLRDVILDRPVFWVAEPGHVALAALAGVLVMAWAPRLESRLKVLVWIDAVALAVAAGAGIEASAEAGARPGVMLVMGVMTGCLGGLMRDVVCNEAPVVLKQGELYATAALAGAAGGTAAIHWLGAPEMAAAACMAATFALRAGSLLFGWRLPTYRSRPPRS